MKILSRLTLTFFLLMLIAGCGGVRGGVNRGAIQNFNIEMNEVNKAIEEAGANWVAAENPISQLPEAERRQLNGAQLTESRDAGRSTAPARDAKADLPSALDWRYKDGKNWLTSVKNQGGCGSCVAFSSTAVVESIKKISDNTPDTDSDLSESHLFSCGGARCANGWYLSSAAQWYKDTGVTTEACLPYQDKDNMCNSRCESWEDSVVKISDWAWVPKDAASIKTYLQDGPLLAAIDVYTDFYYYKSGVYKKVSGKLEGGHAIAIVGYNDAGGYWIIKNSWSANWGDGGYVNIKYGEVGIEDWVLTMSMQPVEATVVAQVSVTSLTLANGVASTFLVCNSTGTVTSTEKRCDTTEEWSTGSTFNTCTFTSPGTYTPGCRVNGETIDNADTTITVTAEAGCGDGILDDGEGCDDGNAVTETCDYGETSCTVCNSSCAEAAGAVSYCGDSTTDITNSEQCDDGNTATEICNYGETSCTVCNANCESVSGSTSYCGDATTDASNGEGCDDGNAITEICDYGNPSCSVCNSNCQIVVGSVSYCGDGATDAGNGENCDDGNTDDGDGCSSACLVETGCGDGTLDDGETCDNGIENTDTACTPAYETDCDYCDTSCQSISVAYTEYCGDGTTQSGDGEACDDGIENTDTACTPTYETDCSYCDTSCQTQAVTATEYCGDGTTQSGDGEQCDDGNTATESCAYGDFSCTVCDSACQNAAGAISYCGDGILDTEDGEQCDDASGTTATCDYGETSCTVCDLMCQDAAGETSYCGDGTTDSGNGETCDDGDTDAGDGCSASCTTEAGEWQNKYGGTSSEPSNFIYEDASGGYILAVGSASYGAGGYDFWLIKLTATGGVEWDETYGGAAEDMLMAIAPTSDGGYIMAGYTESYGAGADDWWVVKVDSSRNQEWAQDFGGASEDQAQAVQQTSDGGYIVAGYTASSGAGSDDAWVMKLSANGTQEWAETFGGTGTDVAYSVLQADDGGFIVAGETDSTGAGGRDAWVIKLSSLGVQEWADTYGGTADEGAKSIQKTSDGGYIFTGSLSSYGNGGFDMWIMKIDSSGNEVWEYYIGGADPEGGQNIQATSDGGYIVVGNTQSISAGWNDYLILKLDSLGNQEWYNNFGGTMDDIAQSVAETSDGGYIVAGYSWSDSAGLADSWVLKLDSGGQCDGCF